MLFPVKGMIPTAAFSSTSLWFVHAGHKSPSALGSILLAAYRLRIFRPGVRWVLNCLEGGLMFSGTWRKLLERYERVRLGDFSYGPGLRCGLFPPGTNIGRFSSFGAGLQVLWRNHPIQRISQHPLFFNDRFGLVLEKAPSDSEQPFSIGNDVWIGMNTIICPGCRTIGDGAIIGAGAVVTRNVPAFTVMAGVPARPVRKRFSPEVEKAIAASAWWSRPLSELVKHRDLFTREFTVEMLSDFTQAFPPTKRVS